MRKFIVILLLLPNISFTFAQFSKQDMDRTQGKLKQEVLDKASILCTYEVSQQYKDKNTGVTGVLTDTLMLLVGKNSSCFYNEDAQRDGMFRNHVDAARKAGGLIIKQGTSAEQFNILRNQGGIYVEEPGSNKSKIYKNRKKNEVITTDKVGTLSVYKCEETIAPQAWEITHDTLTVLGYLCQRATTTFRGRSYNAWFTAEIPINDGPWKLYGLPGLILKATSDDFVFSFTAIGIEKTKDSISMDKDSYIKSTPEQIAKITEKNRLTTMMRHLHNNKYSMGSRIEPWILEPIEKE